VKAKLIVQLYWTNEVFSKEIGASATIDVVMKRMTSQLEEVVVTALGISRDKKIFGIFYAEVQEGLETVKERQLC